MSENGNGTPTLPTLPGIAQSQGLGFAKRIVSMTPRLRNAQMLMAKAMPDTMDVINNMVATKVTNGEPEILTPQALQIGPPGLGLAFAFRNRQGGQTSRVRRGLQGGFGGFATTPESTHSVWGLYGTSGEPQMFVVIREYSVETEPTEPNGVVIQRFVDAEVCKAVVDPISIKFFDGDPRQQIADLTGEAGHALFTWELVSS